MRPRALAAAAALATALAPGIGASGSPDGTTATTGAPVKARFAELAAQPRRIFRGNQAASSVVAVRAGQDVRVSARDPNRFAGTVRCEDHPLQLDRVSGDVTPGGTITASGACFGTDAGAVRMFGAFPGGSVTLVVQSWTDDVVTARIPSLSGVPDQSVTIGLEHVHLKPNTRVQPKDAPPDRSAPARMSFLAQRATFETVNAVRSESCALGDHPSHDGAGVQFDPDGSRHVQRLDVCGAFDCGWIRCLGGAHNQLAPDAGIDTWRLHLPAGFRFDRIEMLSPAADVAIDATIDPTNVTWSVRWRTVHTHVEKTHVGNHVTYADADDGSYAFYVYVTGPVGMPRP